MLYHRKDKRGSLEITTEEEREETEEVTEVESTNIIHTTMDITTRPLNLN